MRCHIRCGAYLAIALAKGIATFGDQYLGTYNGGRVVVDLRERLFDRFLRLSLRYHGEHRVGEGISRLVSDVGAARRTSRWGRSAIARDVCNLIAALIVASWLRPIVEVRGRSGRAHHVRERTDHHG